MVGVAHVSFAYRQTGRWVSRRRPRSIVAQEVKHRDSFRAPSADGRWSLPNQCCFRSDSRAGELYRSMAGGIMYKKYHGHGAKGWEGQKAGMGVGAGRSTLVGVCRSVTHARTLHVLSVAISARSLVDDRPSSTALRRCIVSRTLASFAGPLAPVAPSPVAAPAARPPTASRRSRCLPRRRRPPSRAARRRWPVPRRSALWHPAARRGSSTFAASTRRRGSSFRRPALRPSSSCRSARRTARGITPCSRCCTEIETKHRQGIDNRK